MNKTIASVVALSIIGTTSLAQDAGSKKGAGKDTAHAKMNDGVTIKMGHEGKAATKPGTTSGTKTNSPDIKPARTGK